MGETSILSQTLYQIERTALAAATHFPLKIIQVKGEFSATMTGSPTNGVNSHFLRLPEKMVDVLFPLKYDYVKISTFANTLKYFKWW